ncbi:hypothetical protein ACUTF1_11890, partial [Burkholderia pseudomallei]|uniref:hypothetical protein n=1 Tax=Burkholderia pseudomallei TaxID=28450 RepID=UPI00404476BE
MPKPWRALGIAPGPPVQGLSIDARMPKHIGRLSGYRAYRVNEANEANKAGAAPASQAHAGRRTAR